ncbi:hypothetical protein PLICRDRAFT_167537 [Plicaturopsis crispa FD-325 SS-3]|uniref:Ubiquitin-like protease family profile domain-containing protein n=1 Tax=Plicaturopsis crispa FD-325 SS-3 TaxID=944288 RepID=A0A0C9SXS4_PLICR|nr:hypothetical protein PLICRDRAFT_167537 [Plicaturopsis crispa FD-325 SS-3]
MDITDVDSTTATFSTEEWINKGKEYPTKDVPNGLQAARRDVLTIPDEFQKKLLPEDASVANLLEERLPKESADIVNIHPHHWFSRDAPLDNVDFLLTRPIPSQDFLYKLEDAFGQAWFDGHLSIIDHRFNNGMDRLPLWSLTVWKELQYRIRARSKWAKSDKWLNTESSSPDVKAALEQARSCFRFVPWQAEIGSLRGVYTTSLTSILSNSWLSDDHIDMMMADLARRVDADPKLRATVMIAQTDFCRAVESAGTKRQYTKKQTPTLCRYEADIKKRKIRHLYFPVFVGGNHWIAGCIDFVEHRISYDSLSRSNPPPAAFIKCLQNWLRACFKGPFLAMGDALPHGDQRDVHSCGICTDNTIAHAALGDALWHPSRHALERANRFVALVKHITDPMQNVECNALSDLHTDVASNREISLTRARDHHDVADLASPAFTADSSDKSPCSKSPPHSLPRLDNTLNTPSASPPSRLSQHRLSPKAVFDIPLDLPTSVPPSDDGSSGVDIPMDTDADDELTSDSLALSLFDQQSDRPKVTSEDHLAGPSGISRSARTSKAAREAVARGEFQVDEDQLDRWKRKIVKLDEDAEFHPSDIRQVRHSRCGKYVRVKEPYNMSRFEEHIYRCTPKKQKSARGAGNQTLFAMAERFKWSKLSAATSSASAPTASSTTPPMRPCPGLTHADDPRISHYLDRTATPGGGARSVTVIAKERFHKLFSLLSKEKKDEVLDVQTGEHVWRNDHQHTRVFSTQCKREVQRELDGERCMPCAQCLRLLKHGAFKVALRKPIPKDENLPFVNHRYRNKALGDLYARVRGLRDIIETADAKNTPCIRYAQATLAGKFDNAEVFTGLVEAMVQKLDREERSVGMQNFKYAPAYEEFIHIVKIHSPRAHRFLMQHLQAPAARSLRRTEAKKPRFPMKVCERTFELVLECLRALGYDGPVNLSCDDSKLFASMRLYWDPEEKAWFLVGGTDGPIRVANPDEAKEWLENPELIKATKVRLWCLQIPLPKVTPIIVAAKPIPETLDADTLLGYLEEILYGLIDRDIKVVSYSCDGTEVERAVQRKLEAKSTHTIKHTIPNPRKSFPDTVITIITVRGQAIVMIQDSKHAAKTFRNNLFSGARLLTFGNHAAMYRHIREIAFEEGSPLYHRDVDKMDRQDDNATARLFSAETLQFLADHHPEYMGEIVYLFVFGELVDAYQNRSIGHAERIKLVLRAKYFLESWEVFLETSGYSRTQYFLSREAVDIARIIIDGFIGLVFVYRDHIPDIYPLLPWLHSTEGCEHVFGESRQIVKDFTMLDFFYMTVKIAIKMREAVLRGQASDPRAQASGYCHTYFDSHGIDLMALATFPTDDEIQSAARLAADECDNLIALLGLVPHQLTRQQSSSMASLPGISSWFTEKDFDEDSESDSDDVDLPYYDSEEENDAEELQALLNQEEEDQWNRTNRQDDKLMALTGAALSVIADEMIRVQRMPEMDEEAREEFYAEECSHIRDASNIRLPPLQLPDERARLVGLQDNGADTFDFSILVVMRRRHQTRQAALGVRTKGKDEPNHSGSGEKPEVSMRRQIIRQFHAVIREQQNVAVGTGVEREARWRAPAPGGRDGTVNGQSSASAASGNAANAAAAASKAAKEAAARRRKVFATANVPCVSDVADGRVTTLRPVQIDDFAIILTKDGLMIGRVIALYSKTGGKNGKHAAVTDSSNICAISYLGFQVYEQVFNRQFRSITQATARLQTKQFALLPSIAFLCVISSKPTTSATSLELPIADYELFKKLRDGESSLKHATTLYNKRAKGQATD